MNILYIEDNEDDFIMIREMLEEKSKDGFKVSWAKSLNDGIEQLAQGKKDLILLDFGLPDSKGLESVRKLIEQHFDIPIIVFTGFHDEKLGDQAVESGAQDYLVKGSIDNALLVKSIKYAMIRQKMLKEKELEIKTKELERSNRDLENFAYVASHDLKEPLRYIGSYIELFEQHYKDKIDEKGAKYIKYISYGANRMTSLIESLLGFAKVGRNKLNITSVDTQGLCGEVAEELKGQIRERQVQIDYDKLPVIRADADWLRLVFQNLISNAIKYHGSEDPKIKISAEKKNGEHIFSVHDNGIGIERQYFEKVFVMFERLHGQSAEGGTGMGLTICRKIVERHGGRIWLESKNNAGTTFYFTIPTEGAENETTND